MLNHWKLRTLIPAALVGYVVLALAALPTRRHEIFPFFCWFLFPITPNTESRYLVELRQLDGKPLKKATPFAQADELVSRPHSMDAHVAIQKMGRAYLRNDSESLLQSRRLLEANFLKAPCSYDLVYRKQDAYVLWHGGQPEAERVLEHFNCGSQQ